MKMNHIINRKGNIMVSIIATLVLLGTMTSSVMLFTRSTLTLSEIREKNMIATMIASSELEKIKSKSSISESTSEDIYEIENCSYTLTTDIQNISSKKQEVNISVYYILDEEEYYLTITKEVIR